MNIDTSVSVSSPGSTATLQHFPGVTSRSSRVDPTGGSDLTTEVVGPAPRSTSSALLEIPSQWWRKRPNRSIEVISGFQKWEGRVIEADGSYFTVELAPLADSSNTAQVYAEFESHLLAPDVPEIGDVVYVTARMVEYGHGTPASKTVSVRLRRMGNWTEGQLAEVALTAREQWSAMKGLFD